MHDKTVGETLFSKKKIHYAEGKVLPFPLSLTPKIMLTVSNDRVQKTPCYYLYSKIAEHDVHKMFATKRLLIICSKVFFC